MKLLDQSAQTNWKYAAIVGFLAVILAVGGIFLLKTMEPAPSPIPAVQETLPPAPSPQVPDISTWQTYRSEEYGFELKYPKGFSVIESKASIKLKSETTALCEIDTGGATETGEVSELNFVFTLHSGTSFENIWEGIFGFEFGTDSYDGVEDFGDKKGYYFYRTAEMPIGSKVYVIERNSNSAIRAEVKFPNLVYNCTPSLRHANTLLPESDQILSTFRFVE